MTRMPTDSWLTKARPDLPAYDINTVCAAPGCTKDAESGSGHHLWRRSLGASFREAFWVELNDGTIVPNRVGLCSEHHRQVTDNEVRIFWYGSFFWGEKVNFSSMLDPQPGPSVARVASSARLSAGEARVYDGKTMDAVLDGQAPCPRCKGLGRLPKPPAEDKPVAPARKKAVLSVRVPRDELENGHEVLTSLIESCRDRLANELGWSLKGDASYYTLTAVMHDWLTS